MPELGPWNDGAEMREPLRDEVDRIRREVLDEFTGVSREVIPALYIVKYMARNARNISPGSTQVSNSLRILRRIHREEYRCHFGNFYRYANGAWVANDEMRYDTNHFTCINEAREGIFIALPRGKVDYSCGSIRTKLRDMDFAGIARWQQEATVSSDNSSACTDGKRYKDHWCAKFADEVCQTGKFSE